MYHIVQKNTFREENYDNLVKALERLDVDYEIVDVLPFVEYVDFKTDRKDVFVWGAIKLARLGKNYGWIPGSLLNDNHDFLVYKDHYKENLFNYKSKIINFWDDYDFPDGFFARPTKDTKAFTGQVFNREDFIDFRDKAETVSKDCEIQISGIKSIQKEIRFWIVKGEVITASQYRLGSRTVYDDFVEEEAFGFCKEMVNKFQLADAFVMDICMSENKYYIMECGCINSAGFYKADMQKLVVALENSFN